MEKRTYQHKNDLENCKETNAIFMHLQEHNYHSIQQQEVSYLENEEDWKKRKIKEALYINAMDSKEIMNLEKGFEINPVGTSSTPTSETLLRKKENRKPKFSSACIFRNLYFQNGSQRSCVSIKSV